MTSSRRTVQEAHERFNVQVFIGELNRRHRSSYRVVSEPNPPESIIQSKKKTSWVEVTAAYMNRQFAEDAFSFATPGETHRPMQSDMIVGPDAQFAENFVSVVKKKLEKKSYETFRDAHGPGYLLVSVQYPLFGRDTPRFMRRAWESATFADRGCFRSIYLVIRAYRAYRVVLWRGAIRPIPGM